MIRTFGEKVGEEKEKIRPYFSHTIGWNYRTQELPAAFARSQLKRLPHYNAIGQRNGAYLTAGTGQDPGADPALRAAGPDDDLSQVPHPLRSRGAGPDHAGDRVPGPAAGSAGGRGGGGDALARDAHDVVPDLSEAGRGLWQGLPVELPLLRQGDRVQSRGLSGGAPAAGDVAGRSTTSRCPSISRTWS